MQYATAREPQVHIACSRILAKGIMAQSRSITLTRAIAGRRHDMATSTLSDNDVALLTAPIATIAEQMDLVLGSHEAKLDVDTVRDLIDRLAVYGVTYLWGGSADAGLSSP